MELVKYNVNEAEIAKMSDIYMHLTIKDIDDKEGIESVHSARMTMVHHRNDVNKLRKKANEKAQVYIKNNNTNAKKLVDLMEPIETHLKNEEIVIVNELNRIEAEKEAAEKLRIQKRVDALFTVGVVLPYFDVDMLSDHEYEEMFETAKTNHAAERLRQDEERKAKKAEEKKLADERAEIERIKKEQDAKAKEQEEKEKALQAEKDKIEADKKAEEDRKNREAFEKQATINAKLKAEKDAKEKAEREAKEKKEREEAEAAEKARLEALKPDKEKLLIFADKIKDLTAYNLSVKSPKARGLFHDTLDAIVSVEERLRAKIDRL